MHWIILPSGRALNLAQVAYMEDTTSPYGAHPKTLGVHFAIYDAEAGSSLFYLILADEDRTWLRQYLASLVLAGTWPQNEREEQQP